MKNFTTSRFQPHPQARQRLANIICRNTQPKLLTESLVKDRQNHSSVHEKFWGFKLYQRSHGTKMDPGHSTSRILAISYRAINAAIISAKIYR